VPDKVGIVYAVTSALADLDISIVDVSTQSRSGEEGDVYMMVLEVTAGDATAAMKPALEAVAEHIGVDIELHELEDAVL